MLNTYCPNPPVVYKDAGSLISGATAMRGEDNEQVHDHSARVARRREERENMQGSSSMSHTALVT